MVSLKGNQVEIQPAVGGPTEMKHIKYIKYVLPVDKYINKLLDYSRFGRKTTLRINPDQYRIYIGKSPIHTIPLKLDKQKALIFLFMI